MAPYWGPGDQVPEAHFNGGGGGGSDCQWLSNTVYKFTEFYHANTLHFMFESSTGKGDNKLSIRDLTNLIAI